MRRGDVWWVELPPPVNRRPVLLLSRDRAYAVRSGVLVAFLTTTVRNIPVEVKLTPVDGVPKDCVVNLDLITTLPKSALGYRICSLSAERMSEVASALHFALDL
ncbi:MAG TPA: type II toxin-antitoxin system PemK/MazF family toxin [Tepidisphaeraceae bacterium]|nr:type II toxin-antitoxin system PemK/MazF family toxin [Tepidisphaeraceae bacterium]